MVIFGAAQCYFGHELNNQLLSLGQKEVKAGMDAARAHNEMSELSRTGGGSGIKLPFVPLSHLLIPAQTVKFIWVKKTHKMHFNKDLKDVYC